MQAQGQFHTLLEQHSIDTGAVLPKDLLVYLSELLALRLTRVDIVLEPSFAQRYLELYQTHSHELYKDYADSCLFFTSLLPEYGSRRGLDMDYYATLGISVYYSLGDLSRDSRYTQLGNWFYVLQRFLNTCLHGGSLSYWDKLRS